MFGIKTRIKRIQGRARKRKLFSNAILLPDTESIYKIDPTLKVCIHFHIFYTDLLDEIYAHLVNIKHYFKLIITTTSEENKSIIDNFLQKKNINFEYEILIVENRGRDIYPFWQALHSLYSEFDFIVHLHTKKSLHNPVGDVWRKYLYNNILGNNFFFDNVIEKMNDNSKIGMVAPIPGPDDALYDAYNFFIYDKKIKKNINETVSKFNVNTKVSKFLKNKEFPCGNMFIAKSDAIKQFFDTTLTQSDFPDETGQLYGTLQHYIELFWTYMLNKNRYIIKFVSNKDSRSYD